MPKKSNNSQFKETILPFLKTLGIVVIFSPWLVVAYAYITQHTSTLHPNDQDAIRGFIEWFGTAYSFFLALAVVNVWTQFDNVDREFDRERDALATLLQTLRLTAESDSRFCLAVERFKSEVREEIKRYIAHVVAYYNSEYKVSEQRRDGDLILEGIGTRLSEATRARMILEAYEEELFRSYNEALDTRGDRISHSKPYTPTVIYAVAVVSSVVWLFSFLALVIYDRLLELILIGGVSFVIIMVLIIFFDLGSPFGGIWKIHLEDWQEFLEDIDHENDPRVFFIYNLQNTLVSRYRLFTGRETCHLYHLLHSRDSGKFGEGFLWRVGRERSGRMPNLHCYTLYNNELNDYCCSMPGREWPQVVIKTGLSKKVMLSREQINSCSDVLDLEILFDRETNNHVSGYTL